ncbi:hypothetical protein QVD17_39588 [Tagetes erecta]|uniref:Uncharacterized protein n=1 Tax=Tagetes erecta TaxID=13708 RepID=A0AAD8JNU0_TARER|nr:hypothetical protein QVD17_39588 [Tagetes erecta]
MVKRGRVKEDNMKYKRLECGTTSEWSSSNWNNKCQGHKYQDNVGNSDMEFMWKILMRIKSSSSWNKRCKGHKYQDNDSIGTSAGTSADHQASVDLGVNVDPFQHIIIDARKYPEDNSNEVLFGDKYEAEEVEH